MIKTRLLIVSLFSCLIVSGQVDMKDEPKRYVYGRGAMHCLYTITDNLCYLLECKSQIVRVSDYSDTAKFRVTDADTTIWRDFRFYELSTIDSALIPWEHHTITAYLSKVDNTHFFGRFSYARSGELQKVLKGTITSANLSGGIRFDDNESGEFVGSGCTGSIIYDDNGYLTIAVTVNTPVSGYAVFNFQYELMYYRKNKARVEFDVPFGYWAWFIKGTYPGVEAKIEIDNSGRPQFSIGNDPITYRYQNSNIKVSF